MIARVGWLASPRADRCLMVTDQRRLRTTEGAEPRQMVGVKKIKTLKDKLKAKVLERHPATRKRLPTHEGRG